jgi:hypothetical protein
LSTAINAGVVHARGDVPVDGADLVARLVGPHFGEGHSAALEGRVIPAREGVLHGAARADLDAADLADELGGSGHDYGTSIFSRIR